jgi:hypothetical protein
MYINKFTYELKKIGESDFLEIDEDEVILILYKNHKKITPLIKQMLFGKEITTPDGVLKLTVNV